MPKNVKWLCSRHSLLFSLYLDRSQNILVKVIFWERKLYVWKCIDNRSTCFLRKIKLKKINFHIFAMLRVLRYCQHFQLQSYYYAIECLFSSLSFLFFFRLVNSLNLTLINIMLLFLELKFVRLVKLSNVLWL